MRLSSKTKVTAGLIIAVVTVLTPAAGSLIAMREDIKVGSTINSRQDESISDVQKRQDILEEKINKIAEDTGFIRGYLKQRR